MRFRAGVWINRDNGLRNPFACCRPCTGARQIAVLRQTNTGVEIRIVDENDREAPVGQVGEILIKAASNMKGYWNNPDATKGALKDGWFYSGDAGYADDEGYIFIHDRVKDDRFVARMFIRPKWRTRYFRIPALPMLPLLAYRMKNGARR